MDVQKFQNLYEQALSGALSRRQVLKRAAALGLSAPVIATLLAACGSGGSNSSSTSTSSTSSSSGSGSSSTSTTGSTSATGSPSASPGSTGTTSTGSTGSTAGAGRRQGRPLNLLWWEAPTILNPHLSQGTKDYDATRPVLEPLADFDPDGKPVADPGGRDPQQ